MVRDVSLSQRLLSTAQRCSSFIADKSICFSLSVYQEATSQLTESECTGHCTIPIADVILKKNMYRANALLFRIDHFRQVWIIHYGFGNHNGLNHLNNLVSKTCKMASNWGFSWDRWLLRENVAYIYGIFCYSFCRQRVQIGTNFGVALLICTYIWLHCLPVTKAISIV